MKQPTLEPSCLKPHKQCCYCIKRFEFKFGPFFIKKIVIVLSFFFPLHYYFSFTLSLLAFVLLSPFLCHCFLLSHYYCLPSHHLCTTSFCLHLLLFYFMLFFLAFKPLLFAFALLLFAFNCCVLLLVIISCLHIVIVCFIITNFMGHNLAIIVM